jgi:copper chaperone CopZ
VPEYQGEVIMDAKTVLVPNIHCNNCVNTIQRELAELEGVTEVKADATSRKVSVTWQSPATWTNIESLLIEIGFEPQGS